MPIPNREPAPVIERCACGAVSGFECNCDVEIIKAMHYSGALKHDPVVETMRIATGIALLAAGAYLVGVRWLTFMLLRE
jgi:hypothetical protein